MTNAPLTKHDLLIDCNAKKTDVTIHLEMDVALDIQTDLESLARMNPLGHYKSAIRLFNERLASHVDFFPVVAEYADLLLQRGDFGQLYQFLGHHLSKSQHEYKYAEKLLMRVLRSFAQIHTKGALLPALNMALEIRQYLIEEYGFCVLPRKSPTGIEVRLHKNGVEPGLLSN